MSVCADANITGTFLHFFGCTKFIVNFIKVDYKISTMVAFCPCGLLSGVGIFSGLLSGGLMSGGLLSVHHSSYPKGHLPTPKGNFGETRGVVGKHGVLEHKSSNISETRKDREKVSMEGL